MTTWGISVLRLSGQFTSSLQHLLMHGLRAR